VTEGPSRARSFAAPAAAALALLAILPLLSGELGTLGGDNAEYVLLAKSLRALDGYASGWYPGPKVAHTQYPPLFPLLLVPFVGGAPGSFLPCHVLVALFGAGAVYLLARLFERRGLPPLAAAAGALVPALSILWLQTACEVLSELPFLFFVAATLLLLDPGEEERLPAKRIVGAAVCAGLAFYTRTAGLALVLPVAIMISLDRRTRGRTPWIAAGSLVAACGLWFVYGAIAGSAGGYGDQLQSGSDGLFARGWSGFRNLYFPNTPSFAFPHPGIFWNVAGWILWGLAGCALVQGFLRRRCLAVTEMFFVAYLVMQSAWPFADPRFAIPLAFLLVLLSIEAVRRWPTASLVFALLLLLPNAQRYFGLVLPRASRECPITAPGTHEPARVPRTWTWNDDQYRQAATALASYLHACDLVREGAYPPGTLLVSNPRVAALLCGRHAVQAPVGEAALVLVDDFAGPRSEELRKLRRTRADDFDLLLTLPGGVELLRVKR
jgi:hypothetical protein